MQQDKHIHNCMLLGGLDDQDPAQWDDADVRAMCIDPKLHEAGDDDLESTSDSEGRQDERSRPEVENRHASGMGSMVREDSVPGTADKASTVDTAGEASAQLVIPRAQELATTTTKSTRRMMRAEMIPRARE